MQIVICLLMAIAAGIVLLACLDQEFAEQLREKSTLVTGVVFAVSLGVGFDLGVYFAPPCSACYNNPSPGNFQAQ